MFGWSDVSILLLLGKPLPQMLSGYLTNPCSTVRFSSSHGMLHAKWPTGVIFTILRYPEVEDKDRHITRRTPNSHVKMFYMYLMAWFMLHYLEIMTALSTYHDYSTPYMQCFNWSIWKRNYIIMIHLTI